MSKLKSRSLFQNVIYGAMLLGLFYAVLLVPDPPPPIPETAGLTPFDWNRDAYWQSLESAFVANRARGCDSLQRPIGAGFIRLDSLVAVLSNSALSPKAPIFGEIEQTMFALGPKLAVCPDRLSDHMAVFSRLRFEVKRQSRHWDMNTTDARGQIYRLLYGSRAAIEEVMLQDRLDSSLGLVLGNNEPSATPATTILGVTVHSGDILTSRGGAPTSALIARGSDYPGNFSHVALVYVDPNSHEASIVEAHIEIGVALSSLDRYLQDKKLRVMVLRPRSDLPALRADPMLPHRAASTAIARARREHIPYDFAMDYQDDSKWFCSEVASSAYRTFGITFWMGVSSISSPGVASWLSAFGVRHFKTQEPSDLEYDPQLTVVAEWRDPASLWQDHIDNAIIDVMLERAERGDRLNYDWYLLPFGRLAKAYSVVKNWFGATGPVPEGMSAAAALRNDHFSKRHAQIKAILLRKIAEFEEANGYRPPYWMLVSLTRLAVTQLE